MRPSDTGGGERRSSYTAGGHDGRGWRNADAVVP